jgi:hypothetical protein
MHYYNIEHTNNHSTIENFQYVSCCYISAAYWKESNIQTVNFVSCPLLIFQLSLQLRFHSDLIINYFFKIIQSLFSTTLSMRTMNDRYVICKNKTHLQIEIKSMNACWHLLRQTLQLTLAKAGRIWAGREYVRLGRLPTLPERCTHISHRDRTRDKHCDLHSGLIWCSLFQNFCSTERYASLSNVKKSICALY